MIQFRLIKIRVPIKCNICDLMIFPKNQNALESLDRIGMIIICEDCAYSIHCAYEGNM